MEVVVSHKQPGGEHPAPTERYRGFFYAVRVSYVEGGGFTGQAEIVAGAGLTIGVTVGSADLVLKTKREAGRTARSLAMQWIDENAGPQKGPRPA